MINGFPMDWRRNAGLLPLMAALGGATGDTRFVGGFVRDTLLGTATNDVDCATRLQPQTVVDRVRDAGFKAVPTGIAHGTITAVLPSGPVEITTLRRDVSTDGRRATIAFTDDWREDAARRDFTINALSADPETGEIHDYFDGRADLAAGIVRFIGDPLQRIGEDHLRILRFFRFHARFNRGAPDMAALAACTERANDLMALSRERIADELLKLLGIGDPLASVALMVDHGIFCPVLPEIDSGAPHRLAEMMAAEQAAGIAPHAIRRLAALLPRDEAIAQSIGTRLKLSNAARKRLTNAVGSTEAQSAHALAYALGSDAAIDRLLLNGQVDAAKSIVDWPIPRLPISGGALVTRGLVPGPAVAAALKRVENQWIAEDFPDQNRVLEITDAVVRAHPR